jgi:hypothetical protein
MNSRITTCAIYGPKGDKITIIIIIIITITHVSCDNILLELRQIDEAFYSPTYFVFEEKQELSHPCSRVYRLSGWQVSII